MKKLADYFGYHINFRNILRKFASKEEFASQSDRF